MMNDASELMYPPKLARLNDGSSTSRAVMTGNTTTGPSAPTQVSGPSTISAGDMSAADNPVANNARPENKMLQVLLSPFATSIFFYIILLLLWFFF